MITHHLPDDWLLGYASATATPAETLFAACHLALCDACRARAVDADEIGGALWGGAPMPVSGAVRSAVLDRLDEAPPPTPFGVSDPDDVLPAALTEVVGRFADLPWRWAFPGVDELRLDVPHLADGPPARLFRIAAGGFIPAHQHRGVEASLVLTGGFADEHGHFVRGDVCVRDEGTVHGQRMDEDEPCVVLLVADRPFRGRSPLSWLAQVTRGF